MADKAFLTGINQYKTIGNLRGCVNDTESLHRLLTESLGFDPDNVRVKKDADVTKATMKNGWKWLLKDAEPGDRLVFHFSGHGSQIADVDGDEEDGADELLCLYGMDWNDPKTYVLDDEIHEWTKQIPAGVAVTFLLDCCHSGTGTRTIEPIMSRAAKTDFRSASLLSLDDVALARESAARGHAVGAVRSTEDPGVRPAREELINEATVLARYAPPPVDVQVQIDKVRRRSSMRDVFTLDQTRRGEDAMNHVLWSGCKDDQTSADAYIDNDFHGAFTYYFCQSVRGQAAAPESRVVIERVRQSLQDNRFSQVPQLEPAHADGEVFRERLHESSNEPSGSASTPSTFVPTAGEWQSLLQSLNQLINLLGGGRADGPIARAGGRSIVYVHGICQHASGYSNSWWNALQRHLPASIRADLAANRHEVLWSDHVTRASRSTDLEATVEERRRLEMLVEAVLQERAVKEAEEQLATADEAEDGSRFLEGTEPVPRAMLGIPGLNCVDDFVKYLTISRIRQAVIEEFTQKVRGPLAQGHSVEVVSHSWGTVVAYEALRSLDHAGLPGRVHTWFTVGAALAISLIARQMRPNDGQRPALVDRWVNLNARGDLVGGSLRATGMRVDHESLRLPPAGCSVRFGLVAPACAHSSYFDNGNVRVNRDIFAQWIARR